MQSSKPAASTSFATICFSRSLKWLESNGILTGLYFARRAARSGAITGAVGDCAEAVAAATKAENRKKSAETCRRLPRFLCRVTVAPILCFEQLSPESTRHAVSSNSRCVVPPLPRAADRLDDPDQPSRCSVRDANFALKPVVLITRPS